MNEYMSALLFLQTMYLPPILSPWHPPFHLCLSIPSASHSEFNGPLLIYCRRPQGLHASSPITFHPTHFEKSQRLKIRIPARLSPVPNPSDGSTNGAESHFGPLSPAPSSTLCSSHTCQLFPRHGTHLTRQYLHIRHARVSGGVAEHEGRATGQLHSPVVQVPGHPERHLVCATAAQHPTLREGGFLCEISPLPFATLARPGKLFTRTLNTAFVYVPAFSMR